MRRWTNRVITNDIYAMVGIGLGARFFVMPAWKNTLAPYQGETILSLKDYAAEIHGIVTVIREKLAEM